MGLLSVMRRWHFREGMPIREIDRRTGLSRNTIRKYLRSGAIEPKFKVPERPSRLDPYAAKLSGWLVMGKRSVCHALSGAVEMRLKGRLWTVFWSSTKRSCAYVWTYLWRQYCGRRDQATLVG
jgi:hypothetical protein